MNKSTLAGVVGGIAIATAFGSYALLDSGETNRDTVAEAEQTSVQATTTAPAVREVCWDEVVEVQADPRDDKAIAGTATGAVVGGALAKELGDDNDLLTAAGAAAGAFAGRRAQREFQENRTVTTTERRCGPPGSQP